MNFDTHDHIVRNLLVAALNEGLATQRIKLSAENNRAFDLVLDEVTEPPEFPEATFAFTQAETNLFASVSHAGDDGLHVFVYLAHCDVPVADAAFAFGWIRPDPEGQNQTDLVLQSNMLVTHEDFTPMLTADLSARGYTLADL
jgi:hypothetical protein